MLDKRTASIILLIVGIGLLVLSLSADVIGIGDNEGFGPQQTMGTVAGVVITAVGLALTFKEKWDAMMTALSRLFGVGDT